METPIAPAPLLPTVRKRARFLAHRKSPRLTLESCTLQGRIAERGGAEDTARAGRLEVGYTVSRKTGNSVERNRIKRRLRHAVAVAAQGRRGRALAGELIVIARRKTLTIPYAALVGELTKGIDRLLSKSKKAASEREAAGDRPSG